MHPVRVPALNAVRLLAVVCAVLGAAQPLTAATVTTVIGNGAAGLSDREVANPYGVVIGPDGALYFCDLDNQRIRRLDLTTGRTTVIAGTGERGYAGDGGPATEAALNMPNEIQFDRDGHLYLVERDSHAVRRVDATTGVISTVAGTGEAGFSGDGGPANRAQLRQPEHPVRHPQWRPFLSFTGGDRGGSDELGQHFSP